MLVLFTLGDMGRRRPILYRGESIRSSSSSIQYRTLCSVLRTGLYASSPEPHECHGNGNGLIVKVMVKSTA